MGQDRNDAPPSRADRWHIDKGIPIVLIVGLAGQFIWFSYLVGQATSQIADHERRIGMVEGQRVGERLHVLESQVGDVRMTVTRIDTKIDRIVDRQQVNGGRQ